MSIPANRNQWFLIRSNIDTSNSNSIPCSSWSTTEVSLRFRELDLWTDDVCCPETVPVPRATTLAAAGARVLAVQIVRLIPGSEGGSRPRLCENSEIV